MLQTQLNKLYDLISRNKFLFTLIFIFVLLRLPSLLANEIINDEGIYAAVAKGMSMGRTLYVTIWDHKPPLIIWMYYIVGVVTHFSQLYFWMRLVAVFSGVASIVLCQDLLKRLGFTEKVQSTLLFIFTVLLGAPLYLNYEANAEVFIVLLVLVFLNVLLRKKSAYILGILLFTALFLKMQAFIEIGGILALYLLAVDTESVSNRIQLIFRTVVGFVVPFVIAVLYLFKRGILSEVVSALLLDNFAYTERINPLLPLLGVEVPIRLILLAILGLAFLALLYGSFKKKNSTIFTLGLGIFLIEAFCVLFPLRAYAHYFIQLLPGMTLLLGIGLLAFERRRIKLLVFCCTSLVLIHLFFFSNVFFIHSERHNSFSLFWVIEMVTGHYSHRIQEFSERINSEYAGKKVFLYTRQAWDFVYLENFPINKYVFPKHYWRNDKAMGELFTEIDNSDVVVIVDYAYNYKELQKLMSDRLLFKDSIDGYNYYTVINAR